MLNRNGHCLLSLSIPWHVLAISFSCDHLIDNKGQHNLHSSRRSASLSNPSSMETLSSQLQPLETAAWEWVWYLY